MTRRTPLVDAALDRAVTIPSATIHAHVDQIRRKHPHAGPQEVVELLEREYLLVVQSTGGAVGAAAAAPAVGTGVALALTIGDVATFFGGPSTGGVSLFQAIADADVVDVGPALAGVEAALAELAAAVRTAGVDQAAVETAIRGALAAIAAAPASTGGS